MCISLFIRVIYVLIVKYPYKSIPSISIKGWAPRVFIATTTTTTPGNDREILLKYAEIINKQMTHFVDLP